MHARKAVRRKQDAAVTPMLEEQPFPRGVASAPAALVKGDKDSLGRASKRRRVSASVQKADLFGANELHGKLPKFVPLLKFKALTVGAKVWGAVAEVTAKELIVSLPHGLRGHVAAAEASEPLSKLIQAAADSGADNGASKERAGGKKASRAVPALSQLFYIGQLVRTTVIGLQEGGEGSKKRIHLSLHVGRINAGLTAASVAPGTALPAAVKGVEDHGYTLSFGMKGLTGFLKRSTHEDYYGDSAELKVGMLVEVAVTSVMDRRLAHVTTEPNAVAGSVVKDWDGLDIGSLMPGSLVNARIRNVLSDGLLVSFLTYFNGSIDRFHLNHELPPPDWQSSFSPGQRLRARILFVDPATKAVSLSVQRHLVNASLPETLPAVGTVLDGATVRRIDAGFGVLLGLPSSGGASGPAAGFAHVSNLSDDRLDKIEKAFRVGQTVKARVVGHRPMDGLVVLSLRPSVISQHLTSHADVEPGAVMSGKVAQVTEHGLVITLTSNIRAFVPAVHLSDLGSKASRAKYKVGQEVRGRVLERDAASKRIVMTLKKALIGSKLPAIAHLQDALPGSRTHGYVTGTADYGVFVGFYGGVIGMLPVKELPGKPHDCFDVGQVVKVRVEAVDSTRKRLTLGLVARKAAGGEDGEVAARDELGGLQPGDVVQGIVEKVHRKQSDAEGDAVRPAVFVISLSGGVRGRLEEAHLGDHPAAVAALAECIEPGTDLGDLLVLERLESLKTVRLTRKASMLAARSVLPATLDDVKEGAMLPGFVASVTPDACFVRFLGHVTGRAGLAQLAGTFVADPRRNFTVNQSVRAQVVQVDAEKQRFSVTLKPGLVAAQDASLLRSLFADMEFVARLRALKEADANAEVWGAALSIGAVVKGHVHARQEYGVLCDLAAHPDVVGLVVPEQEGASQHAEGAPIQARVLDVSKVEGIVDLSLRPQLITPVVESSRPARDKRKAAHAEPAAPAVGEQVDAMVELLKDSGHYLVASLPGRAAALGFAALRDVNTFGIDAGVRFEFGQNVRATVAALPDAATGGRMLLTVSLRPEKPAGCSSKRRRHERVEPGSIVQGTVVEVHPLHVDVRIADGGPKGRLHIMESDITDAEAFAAAYPVGAPVRAVSVGLVSDADGRRAAVQELTARKEAVSSAEAGRPVKPKLVFDAAAPGRSITGFVQEVFPDHLWVAVSACERGMLVAAESSDDPQEIADFETRFREGESLTCTVCEVDRKRRHVDVTLRAWDGQQEGKQRQPAVGDIVAGRVVAVSGTGVRVQLGARLHGRVPLTDLHDSWRDNAIQGIKLGSGARVKVVDRDGQGTLRLSARPSDGGLITGMPAPVKQPAAALLSGSDDDAAARPPASLEATDLKINQEVLGYVKTVSKGAFVALAADLDARVKLSALADGFVEDPAKAFPEGRLVRGRVVAVDGSRVDLSLRTGSPGAADLADLAVGDTVHGTVKKVEPFGVFVRLAGSRLTGLAHITELADGFVADVEDAFPVGQEVRAKVLRVDTEAGKLSLGLKPSYFESADDSDEAGNSDDDDDDRRDLDEILAEEVDAQQQYVAAQVSREMDTDEDGDDEAADAQAGAPLPSANGAVAATDPSAPVLLAASGPTYTMDVIEGEWDGFLEEPREPDTAARRTNAQPANEVAPAPQPTEAETMALNKRHRRQEKKRLAAEREAAIRQAEEARQHGDAPPETAEQLEALVAAEPDSSMLWIRYVAYLLSTGDIAAARGVAERALQTINYRKEEDKFNVWLAYLNLENTYGEPPEEAALALFQRAAQYTDAKRMHLAALGVFERTGRDEAVGQLVKAACRKFSGSAKVWLRAVAVQLHKGDGEGARRTLDRALQSLPRRKHIKVITQAGLLEFKTGSAERGRSIFEGVLRNYPKRLDLWSVYLDQEVKLGDRRRVEALFERAAAMDLPPKKMKFFFKRWSDYEESLGDAAAVERVKQLATEYIESRQREA